MKDLLIIRKEQVGTNGEQGTRGTAFAYDGPICAHTWNTGELPWIDLDHNGVRDASVSCSPQGKFLAKRVKSTKRSTPGHDVFVYMLQNVPGAIALELHSGNFFGEVSKGWDSNIEGCILMGKDRGLLKNSKGVMQEAVLESKPAIAEFEAWANGEDIWVTITEQFPGISEISPKVN